APGAPDPRLPGRPVPFLGRRRTLLGGSDGTDEVGGLAGGTSPLYNGPNGTTARRGGRGRAPRRQRGRRTAMTETMPITPEEIRQQVEGRVVHFAERPIRFPAFLELSAVRVVGLGGGGWDESGGG